MRRHLPPHCFQQLRRRSLGPGAILAAAALFASLPGSGSAATAAPQGGGAPRRIVIDPGHGGADPGAVGNGIVEKEINLAVALRLRDLLELDTLDTAGGGEWSVQMTRETDTSVSLGARTSLANSWPAERFVSIHHNAFSSPSANGTESFSFANGTSSAGLRDRLQDELLVALGLTDRGPKTANFFVLRETTMPAALTEGGFLTNPGDATVLSGAGAVDASAEAHLFALQRHFGLAPYLPSDGPSTYCVAKTASPGCVPSIGSTGTPSLAASDFVVTCDDVVSQQFGLLIWSRAEASFPLFGATLCVGGTLVRTPIQYSFGLGNGNCSGRLELPMSSAFMQSSGFVAGEDIFAQWWFRDPALFPADPVGLSNGLRFTVMP